MLLLMPFVFMLEELRNKAMEFAAPSDKSIQILFGSNEHVCRQMKRGSTLATKICKTYVCVCVWFYMFKWLNG